jgi:hypothetical protein
MPQSPGEKNRMKINFISVFIIGILSGGVKEGTTQIPP